MMQSGVYQIRNIIDGKTYVGSSGNALKRWYRHRSALRRGQHHSEKLQRAWVKHGEANFVFEMLEACLIPDLRTREQWWMDHLQSYILGYNCTAKALEHNEEVRERLASRRRGKATTPETRKRMSEAHQGRSLSAEHLQKLHSPEARKKAADTKRGQPLDPERRAVLADPTNQAKAAASRLGVKRGPYKKRTQSDGRNKPMSPEHRAKLTGRVVSEETRRKQSEAAKARCRRNTHA